MKEIPYQIPKWATTRDCCLSETPLAEEVNFGKCSISWPGTWLLFRGGRLVHEGETASWEGALLRRWPPGADVRSREHRRLAPSRFRGIWWWGVPWGWGDVGGDIGGFAIRSYELSCLEHWVYTQFLGTELWNHMVILFCFYFFNFLIEG